MLSYDLSVSGVRQVKAALRSIEAEMLRHNQRVSRALGGPAGRRSSPQAEAERAKRATLRANAQASAKKQALIAKEEQAEKRAAERAAAHKERLQQQLSRRQLARFKRETLQETRDAERATRRKARAEEALARRRLSRFKAETLRNDRLSMASRSAMLGGAYRGATAPLAAVGRTAKMAVGLAGSYVVGSSVAKHFAAERSATALANKAFGTPGETRSREQIKQSLMAQSEAIGSVTGNRAGAIEAMDKFVAISGSLPAAQQMAQYMADISDATGADMGDVGRTGGQVLQNLMSARSIDPSDTEAMNAAIEDTKSIMAAMAGQAKIGSIEFSDLAQNMGSVMSATTRFQGNVADLANEMGAISQLAIAGGASSPEEAMTAIKRFSDDLVRNSARFEKMTQGMGIESFFTDESKTQLRGPTEIITDVMRATKGDLTKVQKIFNIRSMKAFEPFQKAVMEEQQKGKTFEEALSTVETKIGRFTSTRMTEQEITTSAGFAREQTGRKFSVVWEDLQMKVGKELAPAVDDLIPAFTELAKLLKDAAPYLSAFIKALVKNPLIIGGGLLAGRMGLGAVGGGIGGLMSVPGMAGGGALAGGGGMSGGGMFGSIAGGTPVRVTNFPPGMAGMNGQIVGQSIGGALVAAGIGASIGAPIAAAISTWGVTEIEKREAKLDEILKLLGGGEGGDDPKKRKEGVRLANKRIGEIEGEEQAKKEREKAVSIGFGPGAMIPGSVATVPEIDPLEEQRKIEKASLESNKARAEAKIGHETLLDFVESTRAGITALDGFYKKIDEFAPPASTPNRGDAPSPVKP